MPAYPVIDTRTHARRALTHALAIDRSAWYLDLVSALLPACFAGASVYLVVACAFTCLLGPI